MFENKCIGGGVISKSKISQSKLIEKTLKCFYLKVSFTILIKWFQWVLFEN